MKNLSPIAISAGEPASIAPLILLKAWKELHKNKDLCFFSVNNINHLKNVAKLFNLDIPIVEINHPKDAVSVFPEALPILNINLPSTVTLGTLNVKNVYFVKNSLDTVTSFALNNTVKSIVTLPIEKYIMNQGEFNFIGHTEYLAYKCSEFETKNSADTLLHKPISSGASLISNDSAYMFSEEKFQITTSNACKVVMMLASPYNNLKVIPVKTHLSLLDSIKTLTKANIIETVKIAEESFKKNFNVKNPKFLILGLNPHAGENGLMGLEEEDIIKPAINELKKLNISLDGPVSPDTAFNSENINNYSAIIGMYHDQVLTPFKALMINEGVNITLGLKFIRTSPDHGTALNIATNNSASSSSTVAAILLANKLQNNNE